MRIGYSLFLLIFIVTSLYTVVFAQKSACATMGIASYYHGWLDGKKTANGEIYNESQMTAAHPSLPFNSKVKVTNLNNHKSIVVRINDRGPFVNKRIIDLSRAAADSLDFINNGLAKVQLTILSYGKPREVLHQQLLATIKPVKKPHTEVQKEIILFKDTAISVIQTENKEAKAVNKPNIKETVIPEIKIIETKIKENYVPKTEIAIVKTHESNVVEDNTFFGLQIGSFKVKNNAEQLSEKIKLNYKEVTSIQEIKKGNISFFRLIIGKFADEKEGIKLKEKLNKDFPGSFMIRY